MDQNINELPPAINQMAEDLGIDKSQFNSMGFNDVFKSGHNTALVLTKISHVYNINAQNNEKIKELNNEILKLNSDLSTKNNELIALQKTHKKLEVKLIKLSNTSDNSILSTILFVLSNIPIGVCGSLIASKDYSGAILFGIAGLILSLIALYLIYPRKTNEDSNE